MVPCLKWGGWVKDWEGKNIQYISLYIQVCVWVHMSLGEIKPGTDKLFWCFPKGKTRGTFRFTKLKDSSKREAVLLFTQQIHTEHILSRSIVEAKCIHCIHLKSILFCILYQSTYPSTMLKINEYCMKICLVSSF